MEFLIHLMLTILTVIAAVYFAIKYDEYENRNLYRIGYRGRVVSLVRDPIDGEWETIGGL